jgi:hypothetical protein
VGGGGSISFALVSYLDDVDTIMGIIFLLFSLISLKNPSLPGSTFLVVLELPPLLFCIQIVEKFMEMLGIDRRFSFFFFYCLSC